MLQSCSRCCPTVLHTVSIVCRLWASVHCSHCTDVVSPKATDLQTMPTMFRFHSWSGLCRVRLVREQVLRIVGFGYLAVQCFRMTPSVLQSASVAQIHALPFLARYSNTSTLVTTSLAFMVRPCQSSLVRFLLAAAAWGQRGLHLCAGRAVFCAGRAVCRHSLCCY